MKEKRIEGFRVLDCRDDAVVIGSGAAGLNAADELCRNFQGKGNNHVVLFTAGRYKGTSYNTGSDKQTYYKLSLSGAPDSVEAMARDLIAGEGVHGDIAYAEAAESVRSFMKLAFLGVPFPTNELGEYVGYKTDHDPRARATSAGPLTSHWMVEALMKSIKPYEDEGLLHFMDGYLVTDLICEQNPAGPSGNPSAEGQKKICGLLVWDASHADDAQHGLTVVLTQKVILATGGPALCYFDSVYPVSQCGMSGMALREGAEATNLCEWQYGLASVDYRWNVSGSYQQVLPRYISVGEDGEGREFLRDYFDSDEEALLAQFKKGYEWPFDAARVKKGSSKIDLAVYVESVTKGNNVYLDFTQNPSYYAEEKLMPEAHDYLLQSDCFAPTPYERLKKMNPAAIDLYKAHQIDLEKEPLRIAVCAQHHNGGLSVDANWESSIEGLFVAGEAAGSFGVHRPGGAALNSTQVGSKRASSKIAQELLWGEEQKTQQEDCSEKLVIQRAKETAALLEEAKSDSSNIAQTQSIARKAFSACAAQFRQPEGMQSLLKANQKLLQAYSHEVHYQENKEILGFFLLRDMLETQCAILSSMLFAASRLGSRGGCVVLQNGSEADDSEGYLFMSPPQNAVITTVKEDAAAYRSALSAARELPKPDTWFESAWRQYRQKNHI